MRNNGTQNTILPNRCCKVSKNLYFADDTCGNNKNSAYKISSDEDYLDRLEICKGSVKQERTQYQLKWWNLKGKNTSNVSQSVKVSNVGLGAIAIVKLGI